MRNRHATINYMALGDLPNLAFKLHLSSKRENRQSTDPILIFKKLALKQIACLICSVYLYMPLYTVN